MNIALVSTRYSLNLWNGTGRASFMLSQGLKDLGHSVTVYTFNNTNVTKKYRENGIDVVSIGGISSNSSKFGILYEDTPAWNEAIEFEMRGCCFDAILCFDWFGYEACNYIRTLTKLGEQGKIIGLVSTLANGRGQYVPFSDEEKVAAYLESEQRFLDGCDSLIAFNDGSLAEVKKATKTKCNLLKLSVPVENIDLAPRLGYVLVQGRIARERCLERAVRATKDLTWISLDICGPGHDSQYGQYIKSLIKRCEVDDRVSFLGWVADENLPGVYASSEIVLCGSIYDPFGYNALDAMAMGVPVVASYESYRGVVEHKKTGMLFQSLTELKDCLEEVHSNRKLRMDLTDAAKDELLTKRTLNNSILELHKILLSEIKA